jgi:FkbM family methyltransferase
MQKVAELVQQGKVKSILDVGANQGYFSIMMKNNFPDLDIFMIEANPFCDNFLRKSGIPYEMVCLSDMEKEVKFYLEDNNFVGTGASYYLEKTECYTKQNFTRMQTKRLDDVVSKTYDLIKLDTQGSELDIMRGAVKTVDAAKYVLIETSLIEYNENAPLKEEIFKYMDSIGFKPVELVENHYMQDKLIQEDWIFEK